ncbi:MAG: secretin N-terminal domain-containing protein [Rhodospirillaceae bacterium]
MKVSFKRIMRANLCLVVVASFALQSCAPKPTPITEPLGIPKAADRAESIALQGAAPITRRDKLTAVAGPNVPEGRGRAEPILSSTPPRLTGDPISINFDGIRLPAFVNTVFGELLKVTFEIDNAVMQRDQMVTLRTAGPLSPNEFFTLVSEVLSNYGISVVYSNNVYRIVEAANVKKPIPRIIRSRAASSVPSDIRPLFYFHPLDSVPQANMTIWLNLIMGDRIQAIALPSANGLVLLGNDEDVRSAVEIIETLDQPYMSGNQSLKLSPAFWSAQKLAQQLTEILTAEGYSIGTSSTSAAAIKLIPVEALNIIIAFSTSEAGLQHVLQWASELDQPSQTVSSQGAFYHQVYNAQAKDIAGVIEGLSSSGAGSMTVNTAAPAANASSGAVAPSAIARQRIMVDEQRNALIFVGTAEEYAQFRTLVQQMDRAPLEVMIEATIAEVTLRDSENLGIIMDYDSERTPAQNQTVVKSDTGGLFFNLIRSRAQILARVNALASNNRLQVLSSPRLVTSSGKPAAISVGTQVPIITAQETAAGQVAGNTSILQSIQYRDTGVILNVQPVINSNRRVELTVSQQVSSAQANDLSGVQSPLIINRSLQTTLSLNDGETVLLGGMIQENFSKGNSGIPYLKDIPLVGNLFKSGSHSVDRTELIVLITPYIIDGPDAARNVRDAFRSKLGEWARPIAAEPAPQPVSQPQP